MSESSMLNNNYSNAKSVVDQIVEQKKQELGLINQFKRSKWCPFYDSEGNPVWK